MRKCDISVVGVIDPFTLVLSNAIEGPMVGNEAEAVESAIDPRLRVAEVWGGAISEVSGFVAIPMSLLRLQSQLEITPTDFGVLLNLLAHRWKAGDVVFPRTTTIAKRMGVTPRTVQRSTLRLVKQGYIRKVKTTNGMQAYDPSPLGSKLASLMPDAMKIKGSESWVRSSGKSALGN